MLYKIECFHPYIENKLEIAYFSQSYKDQLGEGELDLVLKILTTKLGPQAHEEGPWDPCC